MDESLIALLDAYEHAPPEYQATKYWNAYQARVLDAVERIDFSQLRSGQYPVLGTFGFQDSVYFRHPDAKIPLKTRALLRLANRLEALAGQSPQLPYALTVPEIQEMAHHHAELVARLSDAVPLDEIEASTFGNPADLFEIRGRKYTMAFLNYYIRYCFAQKHLRFSGDEVVVELGSGSGYQVEVLKKAHPGLTVLCFDLPLQIYLCEKYLHEALGSAVVVGTAQTLGWTDLSRMQKGGVHFFGSWQFPLLGSLEYDLFWNAASFGEMEPRVVKNYLRIVKERAQWVYLLNMRHGKPQSDAGAVEEPIALEDYIEMLAGYTLLEEQDAWKPQKRLTESGGYFQGVWRAESRLNS